jgi:8-oxo-dGTP diphosphatase
MKLATLCYLKRNGQTLMLHRIKKENDLHAGKWNGLGGKFLPGESPEQCVIREVQEESGLIIEKPRVHGFITFPGFAGDDDWYVFVFSARQFGGQLIDSDEGHLHWIEDERLSDLPLWEGDHLFLEWMKDERFFSALLRYEADKLAEHQVVFYESPEQ